MEEEEELAAKSSHEFPRDLEPMSIEALAAYIGVLEKEILRIKMEIEEKKSFHTGAEALFRK